jgi:predicted Holliday junction resolvase-like endonuclease
METLSFAFGVLAMIATILVVLVVVGIVKVYNQQKQINNLNAREESTHRRIDDEMRNVYQQMHENREIAFRRLDDLQSYVDSRIDKSINKKQVIKG